MEAISSDLVRTLGSLSEDGIFLIDRLSMEIKYSNDALFTILGGNRFDRPLDFLSLLTEEDRFYLDTQFEKFSAERKIENLELRIKTGGDGVKAVLINAYILNGNVFGIIRDISRTREHEAYIINYGARKDALLEMVSHNLSGPLNISHNILDSLEKAIGPYQNDDLHKHVQLIRESMNHCIELVNDFLEDEHLTSANIYLKESRFDVLEKIEVILERLRRSYPDKTFILNRSGDTLLINNDEVKFFQVFHNLASNAVKFTRMNGKIEVIVEESEASFKVHVKDNGIGIPEPYKPLIFEKYSAAGRTGMKGEKSIGMGLYISKKLVQLMNGKISFVSKVNEGSVFTIEMPKNYSA